MARAWTLCIRRFSVPLVGDQAQGSRHVGVTEHLADFRELAARLEQLGAIALEQIRGAGGPRFLKIFGDRSALLGVGDGGLKKILPSELPESLVNFPPAIHRPRNRETVDALLRHRFDALLCQKFRR